MYRRKQRVLSRYRAAIRGSRRLARNGNPFFMADLIGQLEMINLTTCGMCAGRPYKDLDEEKWEIRLRQLLMREIPVVGFYGLARIGGNPAGVAPIPRKWAEHLSNNGVEFDLRKCERKFWRSGLGATCVGLVVLAKLLLQFRCFCLDKEQYVLFRGLTRENLPNIESKKTANLISWYRNAKLVNPLIKKIVVEFPKSEEPYTATGIQSEYSVYPKLPNIYSWLKFFLFGVRASTSTLVAVVCGEAVKGYLLRDVLETRYFNLVKTESLAREYLVSHSSWYDKPLWMEVVELRGSRVTCYFYSTNCEGSIVSRDVNAFGLTLMRWNKFFVWDQCHEKFVRRHRPSANYFRVGSIDFVDDGSRIPERASIFKIAVFDVSPSRPSFLASLGYSIVELEYYSERVFKQFTSDIAHVEKNVTSVTIMRKQKRADDGRTSKRMRNWLRNLIEVSGIIDVHHGVGAARLIDECDAVISMPFTSTAIIAKEKGKPTIYYDPTGKAVAPCDRGIPILYSSDELMRWVQKILRESNRVDQSFIGA